MARNADESKVSEADAFSARVLIPRLLREHAFGNWKRYVSAFALMAVAAACTALTAYLAGDIVNQAYVHRDMRAIIALCVAIVFIFTAKGLATYGHAVILARIANRIVANNQRRVFEKLLGESLSFFSTRHSSEFVARLTYGATAASSVLNLLITAFGRDLLSLIGLVTVMIVQDPALSLIGLVVMPPAILFVRKLVRRARGIAMNQFTGGARIQEIMQESLQGLRIVKAFSLEDEMRKRLDENVDKVQAESNKMARVANRSSPLMESLGGVAIALVFLYAGYRVLETGAAPGEFFSFITAFLLAYEPAKRLARLNIEIQAHLVGVRLLYEVLDSPRTESDDGGKPRLDVRAGLVEFDRVSFSYRPGEPVIRDLSFVAEKGRVTALVGPSGGGKSTVLNLILRLYEIDSGAILIDGQNLQSVSRRSLREQIAFVGQDVHLFRGTVRDNIRFGRLEASDADVIAAARAAFADEFIMAFPNGYDTPVGEQGLQLSGGQRQRIAIARGLIRSAPIILLDEATAALDSESEHQVQNAIRHLCEGRTTIVIAHRLQTIMHADRIHVIEKGGIAESGRHEELLRRQGRYAAFYKLQLRDQETTREHPSLASSA